MRFPVFLASLLVLPLICGCGSKPETSVEIPDGTTKEIKVQVLAVCMGRVKNQFTTEEYNKTANPKAASWVDYNALKARSGTDEKLKTVIKDVDAKFGKLKFKLGNVNKLADENGKCKCEALFLIEGAKGSQTTLKIVYFAEYDKDRKVKLSVFGVEG